MQEYDMQLDTICELTTDTLVIIGFINKRYFPKLRLFDHYMKRTVVSSEVLKNFARHRK